MATLPSDAAFLKRLKDYGVYHHSKENLIMVLENTHEITKSYMGQLQQSEISPSINPITTNWWIYQLISNENEVGDYFEEGIINEAKKINNKWREIVLECEQQAALCDPAFSSLGPFWEDNLDLEGNLNAYYQSSFVRANLIHDLKRVIDNTLTLIHVHPDTLELYLQKESLEVKMTSYLKVK